MLDKVAFRSLEDIQQTGCWLTECIYHDIFTNKDELDAHLLAYAQYNMYLDVTLDKLCDATDERTQQLMDDMLGSPADGAAASGLLQDVVDGLRARIAIEDDDADNSHDVHDQEQAGAHGPSA